MRHAGMSHHPLRMALSALRAYPANPAHLALPPITTLLIVLAGLLLIPAPPGDVPLPFDRFRPGALPFAAGVHAPNRDWQEADYARVARSGLGTVKLMSYHAPATFARLQRDNPGLTLVVRLDTPWNELPAPERFVAAHAPYLRALVSAGYDLWVEIGNEPNLELHPQAEVAFAAWYLEVLPRLRREAPGPRYGFPGLAQQHRLDAWLETNDRAIAASDWLGVHAYWKTPREMLDPRAGLVAVSLHRRFPALPLMITEAGHEGSLLPPAERSAQYGRFVRTIARLSYVRGVQFFILSGTPQWRSSFLDDASLSAIGAGARLPVPLLDGLAGTAQSVRATIEALARAPTSAPGSRGGPTALDPDGLDRVPPTPAPFARRQLLADASPAPSREAVNSRWIIAGPPGSGSEGSGAGLRTTSAYFGTDFSIQLRLPAPGPDISFAIQFATADLLTAPANPQGTGLVLRWDGATWRLQYWRAGARLIDQELLGILPPGGASPDGASASGVPLVGASPGDLTPEGATSGGGLLQTTSAIGASVEAPAWFLVEIALESRSAAAWVWPQDQPQPAQPNAVFAPPDSASGDVPRTLFLPAYPVADVRLEGATRFA